MHTQLRILGSFGFNRGVPWLNRTDGQLCFLCKSTTDDNLHFILDCPSSLEHFDSLFSKIADMIKQCCNASVSTLTLTKISNLDRHEKVLFLLGYSILSLEDLLAQRVMRFVSSALRKIYKIRTERLCELGVPWPMKFSYKLFLL